MKARAVGAVAVLVTMLVAAANAPAATLQPGTSQTPYGPSPTLDYTAGPGEQNVLHLKGTQERLPVLGLTLVGLLVFTDSGAQIQSSECLAHGGSATCLGGAGHVRVKLGDGADRFSQSHTRLSVLGLTQNGCASSGCPNYLEVDAGPGDDVIDVRDGRRSIAEVTCGSGVDTVYDDGGGSRDDWRGDYAAPDCEHVISG